MCDSIIRSLQGSSKLIEEIREQFNKVDVQLVGAYYNKRIYEYLKPKLLKRSIDGHSFFLSFTNLYQCGQSTLIRRLVDKSTVGSEGQFVPDSLWWVIERLRKLINHDDIELPSYIDIKNLRDSLNGSADVKQVVEYANKFLAHESPLRDPQLGEELAIKINKALAHLTRVAKDIGELLEVKISDYENIYPKGDFVAELQRAVLDSGT